GMPPMRCLESIRMRRAQELLASGDLPVVQVGEAVGFRDGNYFSRAFTRCTGVSPTRYRASVREGGEGDRV
ncbi:MAG: helix-turn-helix transcriptional regulator, partial [Firmicutes bacterium]|nr:helix-turn-helix transcriptional regulator [Bacillota bacterium]